MEKKEDSAFRPVARSFDEVIDRFGVEIKDDEKKTDEPLPDIFKTGSQLVQTDMRHDRERSSAAPPSEVEALSRPDISDYLKRIEVTAGAADALWMKEEPIEQRHEIRSNNPYASSEEETQENQTRNPIETHQLKDTDEKDMHAEESAQTDGAASYNEAPVRSAFFLVRWADRIVDKYYTIIPRHNLARTTPFKERLMVLAAMLAAAGIIAGAVMLILSAIPQSIAGKWQPSDTDKMIFEFQKGKVTVSVLSDGNWVEYRRGEYKTSRTGRQDGRSLLEITYEDGVIRHLYYKIEGDTGRFTNVDSNKEQEWVRIK